MGGVVADALLRAPLLRRAVNWLGVRRASTRSIVQMFADGLKVNHRMWRVRDTELPQTPTEMTACRAVTDPAVSPQSPINPFVHEAFTSTQVRSLSIRHVLCSRKWHAGSRSRDGRHSGDVPELEEGESRGSATELREDFSQGGSCEQDVVSALFQDEVGTQAAIVFLRSLALKSIMSHTFVWVFRGVLYVPTLCQETDP